jgi:hypothetical protein
MKECKDCKWNYKDKTNMPCLECLHAFHVDNGIDHFQEKTDYKWYEKGKSIEYTEP